jgi:sulfite exporter TauE/SafE
LILVLSYFAIGALLGGMAVEDDRRRYSNGPDLALFLVMQLVWPIFLIALVGVLLRSALSWIRKESE